MRFLFVCVENSCRSQMAEAFARIHGGDAVDAHSAGSRPSGVVNAKAIASMAEVGYELSGHVSKGLDGVPGNVFDYVITMGCGDECPVVPAVAHEDWDIPDPKDLVGDDFRSVRNLIEAKVKKLLVGALGR